ncbi:MAG: hypothetical protein KIT83_05335, partial [Bryobacterales bacterium]|nr:hypothetical protein [Bryobacterales bacterium]
WPCHSGHAMRASVSSKSRIWKTSGRLTAVALLVWVALLGTGVAGAAELSIVREGDGFLVRGWTAPPQSPPGGWGALFQVSVDTPEALPLLGDYGLQQGTLYFKPRFVPAPSVSLRAVFRPPGSVPVAELVQRFPATHREQQPSTVVQAVYPSGDRIPANLLKLYVHFSAPMQRGEAWKHIRLLDSQGRALDLPFLELEHELWDPSHRRLTVLFDPGRIKRGVFPREEAGGALKEGSIYTLEIDAAWLDASSQALASSYSREYVVAEEDRTPIVLGHWQLQPPHAGTREPLVVEFGEALDHALAQRLIRVQRDDNEIFGQITLTASESRWLFVPDTPWTPGDHILVVDTILEDLAGNKVGRPFDVDTFERVTRRVVPATEQLTFRVRAQ